MPDSAKLGSGKNNDRVEDVRVGQRFILVGILIYFAAVVLQFTAPRPLVLSAAALAAILGVIGIIKMSDGLGYNNVVLVVLVILMFIPLVGLITLFVVNGKATEVLRKHGYHVGLMGAAKKQSSE